MIVEPPDEIARLGQLMKGLFGRQTRYREYAQSAIQIGKWTFIKESVARGQLTVNGQYIDEVEKIMGRRIEQRRPGEAKDLVIYKQINLPPFLY